MKKTDESIVQVPISSLRSFPNHPFQIADDLAMQQLVDSNFQRLPCSICGQATANDRNSTIVPPVYKGRQNKLAEILFLKNIARRRVQIEPFFGRFTAFFTTNAVCSQNSIITFSTGSGRLSAMCMASVICSMG